MIPPGSLETESSICWTVREASGQLALFAVGMDSGTVIEVGRYGSGIPGGFNTGGLAYDGDHTLAFSGYDGNGFSWMAIDLQAQTLTQGQPNDGVGLTWIDNAWVAKQWPGTMRFDTLTELLDNQPTAIDTDFSMRGTRFQAADDLLIAAWHSTSQIEVIDLVTRTGIGMVTLEDFDTWVWGLAVVDGMIHVIDDGRYPSPTSWPPVRINRFAMDGNRIDHVDLPRLTGSGRHSGLWCQGPTTP